MKKINPHQHNAKCLLGIDDSWGYKEIKQHLNWLIVNPEEIADGYIKDQITSRNRDKILGWVLHELKIM